MMKRFLLSTCGMLILIAMLVFAAQTVVAQTVIAQTGGDYDLSWNTLSSGGATAGTTGPGYAMNSAIGQPFAGVVDGIGISYAAGDPVYTLCAGYLCGVKAETRVYLPLVRK